MSYNKRVLPLDALRRYLRSAGNKSNLLYLAGGDGREQHGLEPGDLFKGRADCGTMHSPLSVSPFDTFLSGP